MASPAHSAVSRHVGSLAGRLPAHGPRSSNVRGSLMRRPDLVLLHEAAIANHIRSEDSSKVTLRAFFSHALPLENAVMRIV